MGNCEACIDIGHAPLTTERLADAVKDRDVDEVKRLLDSGVDVNHPVDEEGHTVLDVLLGEHQELFADANRAQVAGQLEPDDITEMFQTQHETTMDLFKVLRKYGATISGP
eukprot:TRINITY_DN111270_c0_g1_i1.p1 TRINITY_DN111270_c0_g1~~TRINITY_DN111270_c0_g1_i1.p1  ORF type:complete len:111 (-),score=24.92 TRINITY_DN111270_c0_g1_i1:64-396(-)